MTMTYVTVWQFTVLPHDAALCTRLLSCGDDISVDGNYPNRYVIKSGKDLQIVLKAYSI